MGQMNMVMPTGHSENDINFKLEIVVDDTEVNSKRPSLSPEVPCQATECYTLAARLQHFLAYNVRLVFNMYFSENSALR